MKMKVQNGTIRGGGNRDYFSMSCNDAHGGKPGDPLRDQGSFSRIFHRFRPKRRGKLRESRGSLTKNSISIRGNRPRYCTVSSSTLHCTLNFQDRIPNTHLGTCLEYSVQTEKVSFTPLFPNQFSFHTLTCDRLVT